MESRFIAIEPYAPVIVRLLQGGVYDDNEKMWNELLLHEMQVREYFGRIGIELIIAKRDGYAFLRQVELDEEGRTIGLIRRMPLSYEVTLICVLLREWLDEFEVSDTDTRNLYVTHKALRERMELFFKEKSNQMKLLKELDRYIDDIIKLGFLKIVRKADALRDETQYEVRRIIKAKITNDKLEEFRNKLTHELQSI